MRLNILVGQSGGPTAAINASLAGVIETAAQQDIGLLGMRYGIEGFLDRRVVDLTTKLADPLELQLLRRTPASYLGSCRYKLPGVGADEQVYARLFGRFAEFGIDAVLYIGGNDSMDTIAKLSAYAEAVGSDIRFIGIPKTIDNDLVGTDHTPGYGSAAKFIATSVREIARDSSVYDLKSVTFVEIMGRNTGWLAGSACLAHEAGAATPDLILLPERPLEEDALLNRLEELLAQMNTVVVAVSEGVRHPDGTLLCEEQRHWASDGTRLDAFGHEASLSGTGRYLANLTSHTLGVKTRAVELSTLQRCASHSASATDLAEAYALGGAGVLAARDGATAKMCALARLDDQPYLSVTDLVDVAEVANREKPVPLEWIAPDGMGVTDDFRRYASPLIRDEVSPVYVDGLPHHIRPLVG